MGLLPTVTVHTMKKVCSGVRVS